jgi:small subunit ribosomal protein S17
METKVRNSRRSKVGTVVSMKMDKTIIVSVERTMRHPRYKKVVTLSNKYYAHDEGNNCEVGQKVTITECRPLSKTKHWRVVSDAS